MNLPAISKIFFISVILFAWPAVAAVVRIGETLCQSEGYQCHIVVKGESWENLFADPVQRDLVRRVNRLNIRLRVPMTIAIPADLAKATRATLSPFTSVDLGIHEKTLIFDQTLLAWGAYSGDGQLVEWGPASGGRHFCADIKAYCETPVGEYHVYSKGGADCKSHTFPIPDGGAPMPYCMFFQGGIALHGSNELPGYNASHGCVRLYTIDAKWLSQNFIEGPSRGIKGTRIVVRSGPPTAIVDSKEKSKKSQKHKNEGSSRPRKSLRGRP